MASRLHRLGNIYTRIDGLIRKGHIKEVDRPLWFDVYKSFPPKYDPTYKRKAPEVKVQEIFYKEDVLRAKIQKEFHDRLDTIDLNSDGVLRSQKLLKDCQKYISEGMSEDEALEKVKLSVGENKSFQLQKSSEESQSTKSIEINKILGEVL